jgi:nitroreductase/dihydropteridine reductase
MKFEGASKHSFFFKSTCSIKMAAWAQDASFSLHRHTMNLIDLVQTRYTTKAFDPTRKLSAEQVGQIEALLRFAPSSTNAQPWHFVIASSDEGKAKLADTFAGGLAFNEPKVRNASHVVVLCARQDLGEAYLQQVLAREQADGRFANDEARAGQHRGRSHFVNLHRFERRDAQHWADKQVYIALGFLLLGAATLGVDACPIEGFDAAAVDAALGLRERGLSSTVVVALGVRSEADFNAKLPKSRLPAEAVISRI